MYSDVAQAMSERPKTAAKLSKYFATVTIDEPSAMAGDRVYPPH